MVETSLGRVGESELITQLRGSQHLPWGEKEKVSDAALPRHTVRPAGSDVKLSSKLPGQEGLETRKENKQTGRKSQMAGVLAAAGEEIGLPPVRKPRLSSLVCESQDF